MRSCRVSPRLLPRYLAQWSLFFVSYLSHASRFINRSFRSFLPRSDSRSDRITRTRNIFEWLVNLILRREFCECDLVRPNFPNRRKSSEGNVCIHRVTSHLKCWYEILLPKFHEDNNVSLLVVLLDADWLSIGEKSPSWYSRTCSRISEATRVYWVILPVKVRAAKVSN